MFEVSVKEVRHRLPAAIDDYAGRGGRARKPGRAAPGDPAAHAARLRRRGPPAAEARAARQARRAVRFPGAARHGRHGIRNDLGAIRGRSARPAGRSRRGPPKPDQDAAGGAAPMRTGRCRQCYRAGGNRSGGRLGSRAGDRRGAQKPAEHEAERGGSPRDPASGVERRAARRGGDHRAGGDRARRRLRHGTGRPRATRKTTRRPASEFRRIAERRVRLGAAACRGRPQQQYTQSARKS